MGDSRNDQELLRAFAMGDSQAFEALYCRHRDFVARLAWRFSGDESETMDVVQETFFYVLRKAPALHLTARFTTFIYPVVKHIALGMKRKRRRFIGPDDDLLAYLPAPAKGHSEPEDLYVALRSLSSPAREVVLMRFVDDLSIEEISQALAIPVGTVKSRLHNGLERLRESPAMRRYFESENL